MNSNGTPRIGAVSGARALQAHRVLLRLGLSLANVFAWVFLFESFAIASNSIFRALVGVSIVYALAHAISIFLTPISAAHLRNGVARSMMWGVIALAAAFVVLGGTLEDLVNQRPILWGTMLFAFLYGAYRALYWIPYSIQETTKSAGVASIWYELLIASMPAFAGVSIATVALGPLRLLFGAATFILVSLFPIFTMPDYVERFSWSYLETFKNALARKNRKLFLYSFFDGMQNAALFLIWPLAVFLIVNASYLMLGVVMSSTLFVLLLLRKPYAIIAKRWNLENSETVHFTLAVSSWIFRLAVGTPLGIIFADTYSHLGLPPGSAIDPMTRMHAADRGSYIDEYSALKEISQSIGGIMMCIVFGAIAFVTPPAIAIASVLLLAAIASGAYVVFANHDTRRI